MILGLSIFFVACGAKDNTNSNEPTTNTATKITYTEKLTYFPAYNGMQPSEYTAGTKTALATVRYTIKDTTDAKVYKDYESILKKDGWTITEGKQYYSIFSKKDAHIANIIFQQSGKDVIIVVASK